MTNKGNGKPPRPGTGPNAQMLRSKEKKKTTTGAAGEFGTKRVANPTLKEPKEDQKYTKMSTTHVPMCTYPGSIGNPEES